MNALIGYTGFVGGNLDSQRDFSHKYNTKNIDTIDGEQFDLVVCSATRPEMWIANANPEADRAGIRGLMDHLERIKAKQFVLISTVAVYPQPRNVSEANEPNVNQATPYGAHRYELEEFCRDKFDNCLAVRLPGLFGNGLKKNIIYDFIHDNNVDRIDSRAVYQFYNLDHIWRDVKVALDNGLSTVNLATEPTSVQEVARAAFDKDFTQHTVDPDKLPNFDMHTKYAELYGATGNYLATKAQILDDIRVFVQREGRSA